MTRLSPLRGAVFMLAAALVLGACSATRPEASPSPRIVEMTIAELAFEPETLEPA